MVIESEAGRPRGRRLRGTSSRASTGRRRTAAGLLLLAGLGLAGCSSGDGRTPTYPVAGRVMVGGEPAAGAFVVFHPVGAAVEGVGKPTARVESDGSFELTTFDEADGAPSGAYAVTVEWRKLVRDGGDVKAGPNVVPEPYRRPDSTPLKVSVAEGNNTLDPFLIKKRR